MSDVRFDGRVAVITGAGGGLGRTYAEELARRGAQVVVNDLGGATDGTGGDRSMAEETVEHIRKAGGTAVANYASVATPEGGAAITKTALDNFGRVDIVINNAGILRDKSFANLDFVDLEAVLSVHLRAAFYVTQPAFRVMKGNGYGRILLTTSTSGVFGQFGQTNYAAAKTGLIGLANVLALEGEKYNIRTNVVAPAAATRLAGGMRGEGERTITPKQDPRQVTPLSLYLVSEECELTRQMFFAGFGFYKRVFIGQGPGWTYQGDDLPTVEDIRDHLDQILETEGAIIPQSAMEAVQAARES